MLTGQQRHLYGIIQESLAATGVCPSYEEMAKQLGVSSKSCVFRLVEGLEERGYVKRPLKGRSRAIRLLRLPDDQTAAILARIAELEAENADLRRRLADALPCLPEEIAA